MAKSGQVHTTSAYLCSRDEHMGPHQLGLKLSVWAAACRVSIPQEEGEDGADGVQQTLPRSSTHHYQASMTCHECLESLRVPRGQLLCCFGILFLTIIPAFTWSPKSPQQLRCWAELKSRRGGPGHWSFPGLGQDRDSGS